MSVWAAPVIQIEDFSSESVKISSKARTGVFVRKSTVKMSPTIPKDIMKTNTSETITPETIRFATSACSLGSFVIAVSAQGVCALALADDTEALFQELRDDFPSAQLVEDPANLKAEIAAAFATLESPRTPFLLPLDLRGSTFQQNVWGALSKVPVGRTTTYADIATKIGSPDAVRAVGTACGANKIAVMIPCHRVLRQDGVLSGYRWGVDRKRALLSKEVSE